MPHVGVHGLAAGHREEGGPEHREADGWAGMDEIADRVPWVECCQYTRRARDPKKAQQADRCEPDQHDRAKDPADRLGPTPLHEEKANQDHERQWHHQGRDMGRVELEALDRAQHGDRRRDHAVAVEQRRADQPDDQQGRAPTSARRVPDVEQREHGDDAALAVVVRPHDQDRILGRHDDDQRPQDQGQDTQDRVGRRHASGLDGLLESIERAGADIAVDDAERRKRKTHGTAPGLAHDGQHLRVRTLDLRHGLMLVGAVHTLRPFITL